LGRWDLRALAKSCQEASYAPGQILAQQGERGVAAFLIVSGTVAVENELDSGEVLVIAELGQGDMVGELSIIDGAERVATLRARTEVDTLILTQWAMQALLKSRPAIASAMLPVIVQRFRKTANELRHTDRDSETGRQSVLY
jgi:CRP-like cAMP-binding protein